MLPSLTRLLPVRPQRVGPEVRAGHSLWPASCLRLLSFNMQAGMGIHAAHHYVTRGHRHLLPQRRPLEHLEQIARLLGEYDVVGLQEVDGGSLRSAYTHQLSHLAERAGFPFWYQQLNRDLGHLGQFSNGLLSRQAPYAVEAHALPGLRGRGLILSRFGTPENTLLVLNVHLSLGARARAHQLAFINTLTADARHAVIMGDLNCTPEELRRSTLGKRRWRWLDEAMHTYPSWKPARQIDHILVSEELQVKRADVLDARLSDHRPVEVELELPAGLYLPPQGLTLPPEGLLLPR
ncbi:MAG: endonuclease/exonuclease/phosphatase family protein [Pedobacter sp.]|nr:endonuclease/exonuclease/phosphatase family protein [Pedobacter sp.]